MFLPLVVLCVNVGTPVVSCQPFGGNAQLTLDACYRDIVDVGRPTLSSLYPDAMIVYEDCIVVGTPL